MSVLRRFRCNVSSCILGFSVKSCDGFELAFRSFDVLQNSGEARTCVTSFETSGVEQLAKIEALRIRIQALELLDG